MDFDINKMFESEVVHIYDFYFSEKCPQIIRDYYVNINNKIFADTDSSVIRKCNDIINKKNFDAVEYRNRMSEKDYIKLLRKKIEIVIYLAECHHINFGGFINLDENKILSFFNLVYQSFISIIYSIFYKISGHR